MVNFNKLRQLMENAPKMQELMEEAFQKVDVDASEFLQRAEFEQVLVQIAKDIGVDNPTRAQVNDILQQIDQNGDNCISRDQFAKLIKKVFQTLNFKQK